METFFALLAFYVGNALFTSEFPTQRPVTRSSDVFFDLRLNQHLSKQWRRRWFETPTRSSCRHCIESASCKVRGLRSERMGIGLIVPSHKSLNSSDKYPTMHHFATEMCIYLTKWCIMRYRVGALLDVCNWSITWATLRTAQHLHQTGDVKEAILDGDYVTECIALWSPAPFVLSDQWYYLYVHIAFWYLSPYGQMGLVGFMDCTSLGLKSLVWTSYPMRQIMGCACAGNAGNIFPAINFKGNH